MNLLLLRMASSKISVVFFFEHRLVLALRMQKVMVLVFTQIVDLEGIFSPSYSKVLLPGGQRGSTQRILV